jgi:uncharacterized protein YjbJ (UPF0337 family)
MMAQYTEEELKEMEEAIPEWKRGALVMQDEEVVEKKKGLFSRAFGKAKAKVGSSKFVQELNKSEEYKEFKKAYAEIKEDMTDFKEKLRDDVETTENKAVSIGRDLTSVIFHESNTS